MINAQALSQARTAAGLSQRKLALLIGLNFQVIRRLEAGGDDGNLTLRDLQKICTTLGVPPQTLLGTSEVPHATLPVTCAEELDLGQARLLRRIHRGVDVRKSLTRDEQQLVLPALVRLRLIATSAGGRVQLSATTTADLADPESC